MTLIEEYAFLRVEVPKHDRYLERVAAKNRSLHARRDYVRRELREEDREMSQPKVLTVKHS